MCFLLITMVFNEIKYDYGYKEKLLTIWMHSIYTNSITSLKGSFHLIRKKKNLNNSRTILKYGTMKIFLRIIYWKIRFKNKLLINLKKNKIGYFKYFQKNSEYFIKNIFLANQCLNSGFFWFLSILLLKTCEKKIPI